MPAFLCCDCAQVFTGQLMHIIGITLCTETLKAREKLDCEVPNTTQQLRIAVFDGKVEHNLKVEVLITELAYGRLFLTARCNV